MLSSDINMSNLFIDLSTKVAETVFKLLDTTSYKGLRYSITFDSYDKEKVNGHRITLQAETSGGSSLWYKRKLQEGVVYGINVFIFLNQRG